RGGRAEREHFLVKFLILARNGALARQIGFTGTPAWVTGDTAIGGAIGYDGLKDALDSAGPRVDG
ncbi:MAG: hypothetical protein AAFN48_13410, partial [Pseudomonadota bacterium]